MSKPARFYWYKRYPAEFFASTHGMPWEIKTAYSLLLDLIYLDQGRTRDDPHRIRNYLGGGMTGQRWNRIRSDLIARGKLVVVDGFLTNPRVSRQVDRLPNQGENFEKTESKVGEAPEIIPQKIDEKIGEKKDDLFSGQSGENKGLPNSGRKEKARFLPESAPPPARTRQNQSPEPEPEKTVDVIVQVQALAEILGQARGRYWEVDYRRMLEQGLSPEAIMEAARAHRGGEIRSLNAIKGLAERKQQDLDWKRKADHPGGIAGAVIEPSTRTQQEWEIALSRLLDSGVWSAMNFGIPPTRPGHVVPKDLFDKWERLWKMQGEHPTHETDSNGYRQKFPAEYPSKTFRSTWEPHQ